MFYVLADSKNDYGCTLVKAENEEQLNQRVHFVGEEKVIARFTESQIGTLSHCRFALVSDSMP